MKILVVSMLRLGDILLATSVIPNLKREIPDCDIDILINGQFSKVSPLIPGVRKVYSFDRQGIQEIIGSADRNVLEAFYQVDDLVSQLREEKYDRVINLTHNRLSGWIAALIGCPDTQGVVYTGATGFKVGSKWFRYLNDQAEPSRHQVFHFIDVFHYGSGLKSRNRRIELTNTASAQEFAKSTLIHSGKRILIQPFSAEKKKTLTNQQWKNTLELLSKLEPHAHFYVLGVADELKTAASLALLERVSLVECNLEQAFGLLSAGDLLLTVDTSIKHMASATKIKVVELSLGSSDYQKTGIYQAGAYILQPQVPCAPCEHRTQCSRPTHECGNLLDPELVAMCTSQVLRQDDAGIRILAHEYAGQVQILRTYLTTTGDWAAISLADPFDERHIQSWADRFSQKLFLMRAHERPVAEFGTEGDQLKVVLEKAFPDRGGADWRNQLKRIETDLNWVESGTQELLGELKQILGSFADTQKLDPFIEKFQRFESEILERLGLTSNGAQISRCLEEIRHETNTFVIVKKIREQLVSARQLTNIELKLIRGLQTAGLGGVHQ
ncbi:MAG: glycosyltransferase family 9 protein [Oligoflexia bacterium]|nr:glycosyltransferase family 9 protein [Oligoflexia bacterium]